MTDLVLELEELADRLQDGAELVRRCGLDLLGDVLDEAAKATLDALAVEEEMR